MRRVVCLLALLGLCSASTSLTLNGTAVMGTLKSGSMTSYSVLVPSGFAGSFHLTFSTGEFCNFTLNTTNPAGYTFQNYQTLDYFPGTTAIFDSYFLEGSPLSGTYQFVLLGQGGVSCTFKVWAESYVPRPFGFKEVWQISDLDPQATVNWQTSLSNGLDGFGVNITALYGAEGDYCTCQSSIPTDLWYGGVPAAGSVIYYFYGLFHEIVVNDTYVELSSGFFPQSSSPLLFNLGCWFNDTTQCPFQVNFVDMSPTQLQLGKPVTITLQADSNARHARRGKPGYVTSTTGIFGVQNPSKAYTFQVSYVSGDCTIGVSGNAFQVTGAAMLDSSNPKLQAQGPSKQSWTWSVTSESFSPCTVSVEIM